jgi:chitinase
MLKKLFVFIEIACIATSLFAQKGMKKQKDIAVIGYYTGNSDEIDKYPVEKLTHIIFSFVHLKGTQLTVDKQKDSLTLRHLVSLKQQHPKLKILVSLGGWGGCEPCSEAFSTNKGRSDFAQSTLQLMKTYNLDGLDLDWEYPAIEGFPKHRFVPEDRENFTDLVRKLHAVFAKKYLLSFAAGGFNQYLEKSIEWQKVMPLVDMVNLMTYDLTNGYSVTTGHHTPLYSSDKQTESTDNAIRFFEKNQLDLHKLIIGAAFYARVWENVPDINNGIFQSGKFKAGISYKDFPKNFGADNGFELFWDKISQAPYYYSKPKKEFATFDNEQSVKLKTEYAKKKGLGGIMFWEITNDAYSHGLIDAIYTESNK